MPDAQDIADILNSRYEGAHVDALEQEVRLLRDVVRQCGAAAHGATLHPYFQVSNPLKRAEYVSQHLCFNEAPDHPLAVTCYVCRGRGYDFGQVRCERCDGRGWT